jgi:hypothetical protein
MAGPASISYAAESYSAANPYHKVIARPRYRSDLGGGLPVAPVVSEAARGANSTEVPGEESDRAVDFEGRDPEVAAGVRM